MRWSLLFSLLFTLLSAASILAAPIPSRYDSEEQIRLEVYSRDPWRNPAKSLFNAVKNAVKPPPKQPSHGSGTHVTAAMLKASSATYRKAALKGSMYTWKGGKLIKSPSPATPPPGMEADHILEAQTAAKVINDSGHTKESLGPKFGVIKGIINSHLNMAWVDKKTNQGKGRIIRTHLRGGDLAKLKPDHLPESAHYIKEVHAHVRQTKVAHAIDKLLKPPGTTGRFNGLVKQQNSIMKAVTEHWKNFKKT